MIRLIELLISNDEAGLKFEILSVLSIKVILSVELLLSVELYYEETPFEFT